MSNILDNWLRTVTGIARSSTAIQAESNKVFSVITKSFVKTFRMLQRHCFCCFSRDVQLQRPRGGLRHLLVINLMRAATRRGGCDGGHYCVCKSKVHNCKASYPLTTQTSLASRGPLASHACSCLPLKLLGGILRHSSYSNTSTCTCNKILQKYSIRYRCKN